VASTPKLLRQGAAGFIDWLDVWHAKPILVLREVLLEQFASILG